MQRIDELEGEITIDAQEYRQLLDENLRLRSALMSYAHKGNWAKASELAPDEQPCIWRPPGKGYDLALEALGE